MRNVKWPWSLWVDRHVIWFRGCWWIRFFLLFTVSGGSRTSNLWFELLESQRNANKTATWKPTSNHHAQVHARRPHRDRYIPLQPPYHISISSSHRNQNTSRFGVTWSRWWNLSQARQEWVCRWFAFASALRWGRGMAACSRDFAYLIQRRRFTYVQNGCWSGRYRCFKF